MAQMSPPDPDRLYNLLPALYRQMDAMQGYSLRALLRLMGNQVEMLRADIQQLWDNFFIETCEQWAIPYIGDLVSNQALYDIDTSQDATTAQSIFPDLTGPNLRPISTIRTRADVAKTIYYRRRKGTAAMLEELAGDVTGWGAHVVQFFQILTWTQNLNHLRLQSTGCADLRNVSDCVQVDGPFDAASHVVDVRAIAQSEGWYNVPNLGFFLWRLESFPLAYARARAIGGTSWRYTFSPLGNSAPLFARSPRSDLVPGMNPELLVPEPIPPSAFLDDLAAWSALPTTPPRPDYSLYYGDAGDDPDWSITVYEQSAPGATPVVVDLAQVTCMNLCMWKTFPQPSKGIAIDVSRGRLVIGADRSASSTIYVSYNYGFSAHLGGGPYADLQKWVIPYSAADQVIGVGVANPLDTAITTWAATLDAAIDAWTASLATPNPPNTIIQIADNDTHTLSRALALHPVKWLAIQALAGLPGFRPHIQPQGGVISINGTASGSTLTLAGLLIEGGIEVTQDIQRLRILHTTLVPGRSIVEEPASPPGGLSLDVSPTGTGGKPINTNLDVQIAFSITGPLQIPETVDGLWLLDSIVDGGSGGPAISNANTTNPNGPQATIERSTILGPSYFREFDLCSDTIFTAAVIVEQRVSGCLRFSFVPAGSSAPQQYHCQPAYEVATETDAAQRAAQASGAVLPSGWEATLAASIEEWLVPSFESVTYGEPEYCQLRLTAPQQIRTGASDGGEMGAFNYLKQAQRETNLRIRLAEYVPFGRAPGIIYVT
jgi:hypothetical protein